MPVGPVAWSVLFVTAACADWESWLGVRSHGILAQEGKLRFPKKKWREEGWGGRKSDERKTLYHPDLQVQVRCLCRWA